LQPSEDQFESHAAFSELTNLPSIGAVVVSIVIWNPKASFCLTENELVLFRSDQYYRTGGSARRGYNARVSRCRVRFVSRRVNTTTSFSSSIGFDRLLLSSAGAMTLHCLEGFTEEDPPERSPALCGRGGPIQRPDVGKIGAFNKPIQVPFNFFQLRNPVSDAAPANQFPAVLDSLTCRRDYGQAEWTSPALRARSLTFPRWRSTQHAHFESRSATER
jgi:hypothetical protein